MRRSSSTVPAMRSSPLPTTTGCGATRPQAFEGVIPNLERRWRETDSNWAREEIASTRAVTDCEACGGHRLKPEALAVKIAGLHVGEVAQMSIRAADDWFNKLEKQLTAKQKRDRRADPEGDQRAAGLPGRCRAGISDPVARQRHPVRRREPAHPPRLADRLRPDRRALRPGRALHRPAPARQRAAAGTLRRLRDLGNTVIVVEHDEEAIRTADYLVDMGPGAGMHGGQVVAEGTPRRSCKAQGKPDRAVSVRRARSAGAEKRREGNARPSASRSSARAATT